MSEVITKDGEDRGYKICKCTLCGVEKQCTPSFDFYTTEEHGDELLCENCFSDYVYDHMKKDKRERN